MYIQVKRIIENLLSFVDWMEADLNESLQYIIRKGAGFKQTKWLEKVWHTSPDISLMFYWKIELRHFDY